MAKCMKCFDKVKGDWTHGYGIMPDKENELTDCEMILGYIGKVDGKRFKDRHEYKKALLGKYLHSM